MPVALTEREIVAGVLRYLGTQGILAWRNNTGAFAGEYKGRRRFVRFGVAGLPDVLGVLPGGTLLAIECKRRGQKPTPVQEAMLEVLVRQGAVAFVTHSWQEVREVLGPIERR